MTATKAQARLVGHDRCDACPVARDDKLGRGRGLASAVVRVLFTRTGKTLDFCKHHFEANEATLFLWETEVVIDQREAIDA